MAEKSGRDQANRRQKLGLVWRNRKKISQIIKDYFYLPFFLLIILCPIPTRCLAPIDFLKIPAQVKFLQIFRPDLDIGDQHII
jgi:hypothetical protein